MGFLNDVKQEWTWEGIKANFKERWPDLLAVFIAGWFTPFIIEKFDWENCFWTFLVIWIAIAVTTGVIVGVIKVIIKKLS